MYFSSFYSYSFSGESYLSLSNSRLDHNVNFACKVQIYIYSQLSLYIHLLIRKQQNCCLILIIFDPVLVIALRVEESTAQLQLKQLWDFASCKASWILAEFHFKMWVRVLKCFEALPYVTVKFLISSS